MNGPEYRAELNRLGLMHKECVALFKYSVRTASRWARSGPPLAVGALLKAATSRKHLERLIAAAR